MTLVFSLRCCHQHLQGYGQQLPPATIQRTLPSNRHGKANAISRFTMTILGGRRPVGRLLARHSIASIELGSSSGFLVLCHYIALGCICALYALVCFYFWRFGVVRGITLKASEIIKTRQKTEYGKRSRGEKGVRMSSHQWISLTAVLLLLALHHELSGIEFQLHLLRNRQSFWFYFRSALALPPAAELFCKTFFLLATFAVYMPRPHMGQSHKVKLTLQFLNKPHSITTRTVSVGRKKF